MGEEEAHTHNGGKECAREGHDFCTQGGAHRGKHTLHTRHMVRGSEMGRVTRPGGRAEVPTQGRIFERPGSRKKQKNATQRNARQRKATHSPIEKHEVVPLNTQPWAVFLIIVRNFEAML